MAKRYFTKEDPPISGKSKKLWDWFTATEIIGGNLYKASGISPDTLQAIVPGYWQKAAGAAEFEITWMRESYYCHSYADTIKKPNRLELGYNRKLDSFYLI